MINSVKKKNLASILEQSAKKSMTGDTRLKKKENGGKRDEI